MSYHVLARKWRPGNFSELVGQEHVVAAISNALDNNRLHHAYLFTGTRGVGKTTIARIFSKSLNCEQGMSSTPCGQCGTCQEIENGNFVDLLEIDAASRTKVEDTREILDNVQYKPTRGEYKVYLIDEVHMLSKHSFNALLKTLEEPPPHVKFLLATTDPQKLPITILSRCLQFNLKALSRTQISEQLTHILGQEGITHEPAAISQLARAAQGSMRDALSLTDQAIAQGNGNVTGAVVTDMLGLMDKDQILKLVHGVISKDADSVMKQVESLSYQAPDYTQVIAEIMSLLHQVALTQFVPDACKLETVSARAIHKLSTLVSAEHVQLLYQIALQGKKDLPFASDGRAGLEMTLLRMLAFSPAGVNLTLQEIASSEVDSSAPNVEASAAPVVAEAPATQASPAPVTQKSSAMPDALRSVLGGQKAVEEKAPEKVADEPVAEQVTEAAVSSETASEPAPAPAISSETASAPAPAMASETAMASAPAPAPSVEPEHVSDFDQQMMAQLEQQQQGIIEQAQDFHPEQFAQPEPQATAQEDNIAGGSLSSTASLLALKQRVQDSAGSGLQEKGSQEENNSPAKKSEADTFVNEQPSPSEAQVEQSPEVEPSEPVDASPQSEITTTQQASGADSTPPWEIEPLGEPVGKPVGEPAEEVEPLQSEQEPVVDFKPSQPAPIQVDTQIPAEPAGQNNNQLAPPWNVESPEEPLLGGRAAAPQFIEPAEEFDPNAHLDEKVDVEVDFDVPVFLESGEKVLSAPQLDTWSQLIQQMQVTALTKQLALHSAYQKVENKVILTLLESKEHLISETAIEQLTYALSQALQQEITLEIKLEQPINTPYAVQQKINRVRQEHAHHVIETDEALVNIRNTFSANVVEGSVKAR